MADTKMVNNMWRPCDAMPCHPHLCSRDTHAVATLGYTWPPWFQCFFLSTVDHADMSMEIDRSSHLGSKSSCVVLPISKRHHCSCYLWLPRKRIRVDLMATRLECESELNLRSLQSRVSCPARHPSHVAVELHRYLCLYVMHTREGCGP